jgi:hypothetical protein
MKPISRWRKNRSRRPEIQYLSKKSCCRKGRGPGGVTSLTSRLVDISFKDDVTVVLLLGVSFMGLGSATEIENKQGLDVLEKPPWKFFEGKRSTEE